VARSRSPDVANATLQSAGFLVAYFSMELALENHIPTYSGGLGVLGADTLRSAGDLQIPMIGVSLVHRHGYFFQRLTPTGAQIEEAVRWSPDDWLAPAEASRDVDVEGRQVRVRAWRYTLKGCTAAPCRSSCSTRMFPRTTPTTGSSPTRCTAAISGMVNASFFNTHRMLDEYVRLAYREDSTGGNGGSRADAAPPKRSFDDG